jgi:hypothetical protein
LSTALPLNQLVPNRVKGAYPSDLPPY